MPIGRNRDAPQNFVFAPALIENPVSTPQRVRGRLFPGHALKRDDFSSNRHHALADCLSMIFSENRDPLFGIVR
jgi:hypothetical protein